MWTWVWVSGADTTPNVKLIYFQKITTLDCQIAIHLCHVILTWGRQGDRSRQQRYRERVGSYTNWCRKTRRKLDLVKEKITLLNPLIWAPIPGAKSFFRPVDSLKVLGIKVSTIGWFKRISKNWKNKRNWYKLHQQHSNNDSLDSPVTSKHMLLTSNTLMFRKKKIYQ